MSLLCGCVWNKGDQAHADLCPHHQHARQHPPAPGPLEPAWHCPHPRPGPGRPLSCPRSQPRVQGMLTLASGPRPVLSHLGTPQSACSEGPATVGALESRDTTFHQPKDAVTLSAGPSSPTGTGHKNSSQIKGLKITRRH